LLIAKKIGAVDRNYGIWVRVHAANKRLHPCLQGRFQGAQTWGQAVTIRTGGSQGFRKLPTIKDEGYVKDPQTLTLDLGNCDLSKLNSQDAAALNRRKVNNRVVI
jgi:hypothetical protein